MKKTLIAALSILLCPSVLAQSDSHREQDQAIDDIKDLPKWVINLSNLPNEKRVEYVGLFSLAKEAYRTGNWVKCLTLLNNCELLFDENPNVWNLQVGCYIEQKNYTAALELAKKAHAHNPKDEVAMLNLSSIYLAQGQYQECIDMINSIFALIGDWKNTDLRHVLIYRQFLCYIMQDKMDEARKLVSFTRPMDDTPLYYMVQGTLYIIADNKNGAKAEFDSANRVFIHYPLLRSYNQAFGLSGISEKYLGISQK